MRRVAISLGQALLLSFLTAVLIVERVYDEPLFTKLQNRLHVADNSTSIESNPSIASSPVFTSPLPTAAELGYMTTAVTGSAEDTSQPDIQLPPAEQSLPKEPQYDCNDKSENSELNGKVQEHLQSILNSSVEGVPRLDCQPFNTKRYSGLGRLPTSTKKRRYIFAMDLYQSAHVIPQLLGSVVDVIRLLGPEFCVVSIVEGRSTDGTFEILKSLGSEMEKLGVAYYLSCNEYNPNGEGMDRISTLAELRNQALRPLIQQPGFFDFTTTIIFLNDIAPCAEDILELIHQRILLKADMTCAMDWVNLDDGGTFYDAWIGRQINGDLFFEVPQSTSWDFSKNLFWNHEESRVRYLLGNPVQVFSCWNGAVAITAKPFLEGQIQFRTEREGECHLGEPVHLAKDLWRLGYGKIAVLPSVNVGYNVDDSAGAKKSHGSVSLWTEKESPQANKILWLEKPPGQIKCLGSWDRPSWEPWDPTV